MRDDEDGEVEHMSAHYLEAEATRYCLIGQTFVNHEDFGPILLNSHNLLDYMTKQ